MLSPGMLFPAAYLLVYLSTNIYLNADFKKNLSQSVARATSNTWHLSIKSLNSGPGLDSIMLNTIELTPVVQSRNSKPGTNHAITIKTIEIACPELQNILFSHKERLLSTRAICEKILSDERLVH